MVCRVLIIDTETDGLGDDARVIEVGAILYSVEHQCALQELATLLPAEENEAEGVNRIRVGALRGMAEVRSATIALELLYAMSREADCYVAHNAEFDSRRVFGKPDFVPLAELEWLCTMADFKWPQATREQGSLINLALDHGIGVGSAHRALTDCRLIAALFDRMVDLPAMFEVAMRPKAVFQALVPFERKGEAKNAGFKWNAADRSWTRRMAVEDAAALPFPTRRL